MRVIGEDFELFWVSDERGEVWRLSKALQERLSLSHATHYRDVMVSVHPRDRAKVSNKLAHAHENHKGIDVAFQVWLPENGVFARAKLVGWPRFVNGRFIGHIGFWRIKLPSFGLVSAAANLFLGAWLTFF